MFNVSASAEETERMSWPASDRKELSYMRKLERRFLLQAGSGSLPSGGKPEADREPAACPSGRRRGGRVRPPVVSSIRPWEVSVCLSVCLSVVCLINSWAALNPGVSSASCSLKPPTHNNNNNMRKLMEAWNTSTTTTRIHRHGASTGIEHTAHSSLCGSQVTSFISVLSC